MEGGAMNLSTINHAIKALCSEEPMTVPPQSGWHSRTEDELFFDLVVCTLSSQTLFELALATAESLKRAGLVATTRTDWGLAYEEALCFALRTPVRVESGASARFMIPRFRNRMSKLIAATSRQIYGQGTTLKKMLASADSPQDARRKLVSAVAGFGPKQASLYLRRVYYCADLAILDTHVLDYLKLAADIDPKPSSLSCLSAYERLEAEFRQVAKDFGYSVGCLDLATWVTMRVAKRGLAG
jgi:N-glycosylase/DNA lyase